MLITGGAGFIGVNAAARFLRDGWHVTVFDDFSRRGTDINRRFLESTDEAGTLSIVRGDIRNPENLHDAMNAGFDVVLHLAAQVAVTTSVTDPRTDFAINAFGTLNVLEAARQADNKPFLLFASTNKVYGGLEDVPVEEGEDRYRFGDRDGIDETRQLDFHSPYGCSKGAADQYVRDYARIYDLPTVVFRQSCIYGPHQMGIEDQGWVAWFMIAGMFGRPMTVYGNGKQVRDLLYIDDLTDAFAAAIEKRDTARGKIYNVGGGPENTLSLREFLDFLRSELHIDLKPGQADTRPGDQPIFVSDNTLIGRELGWKPVTSLQKGIPQLHAWLKENQDSLRELYS